MAHYGTLHDFEFSEGLDDEIRGSSVYGANDEKLGKIKDVIFDHTTGTIRYAVVDTGGWLSTREFIVPAEKLNVSQKHPDDYSTQLTKQQVEKFPAYSEKHLESEEKWRDYEKRYKAGWEDDPIQHRDGSDHDVTPTPDEMPPETGSAYSGTRQPILETGFDRVVPATANEVEIPMNGAGIGARWSTFEDRLRERRREIAMRCTICNRSVESETASDRERDAGRKAS
jgi:PRC-barrel domain